jgi:hypothetical protein
MKKTTISFFVVGLLLISSFAATGLGKEAGASNETTMNLQFSEPSFTEKVIERQTYELLTVGGASALLYHAGQPILPMYTTKLTFPFGTRINSVEFVPQEVKTMVLPNKIMPTPQPIIPDEEESTVQYIMDETIYNSANLFPDNWVNYYTGGGLDENNEHATFLIIQAYPTRYSPATNTINYVEAGVLTITYEEPANPVTFGDAYDLVIIAPSKFSSELQNLVTAKIGHGVTTKLMTTEEIYDTYTGVDKPEQIKYFIKYALETWGTKYVLLVGGLNSLISAQRRDDKNQGSEDWYVPVRYTNNRESGADYDPGLISDLYYADIYNSTGAFDSWDSNHDGVFAKWGAGKDKLDLYPDVAVGRLTCRNKFEVKIMVNKIINYEKAPAAASWFDTMILVGGDSFDDVSTTNYYEGEVTTNYIYSKFMTEFTPVKIYSSNKDTNPDLTPTPANLKREISAGAGHLLFDGHGSPKSWNTHYPGVFDWANSPGGISIKQMPFLSNGGKLPVCVVGGCHNSLFNITLMSSIKKEAFTFVYGSPCPECWSEWLTRKIGGGAIATMGNTGFGYGTVGENGDIDGDGVNDPDCIEALGGYQERTFYKAYDEGKTILGDAWKFAQTYYQDTFPGMADQTDCKTLEQWALIGDPSLKIGGYPAAEGLKANIENAEAGVVAAPGENVVLHGIASDGQAPYTYAWDLNEDGVYDDATGSTLSHTWNLPGVYWVSLKVTDGNGNVNTYDTVVGIELGASTPSRPEGPSKIKVGETQTYATSIDSTNWDNIYYKFSWGDGTESEWLEAPSASHSWNQKGKYQIQVKALLTRSDRATDSESVQESDWSAPLAISTPKVRQSPVLMQFLEKLLEKFPNAFPIMRQLLGL